MDLKSLFQNKWLLVLGVVGLLCLLFGSWWSNSGKSVATTAKPQQSPSQNRAATASGSLLGDQAADPTWAYEQMYEQQLTSMLEKMSGIHAVSVMVTVDSTATQSLATNTRQTRQTQSASGKSTAESNTVETDIFTTRNADGSQTPYVLQSLNPTIRGVFVLVRADDFYVAKAQIIDAIGHVLDVPAYKISVEPE